MSGSSRRRHSKWDDGDSEALPENFFEKDPPCKTREPLSPSRGSRRHESHTKERMVQSDREDDNLRLSPGLDESRYRHQSRSPRNGRGRSYRSRSRSRSRSPTYNHRQEPALTERSRDKSRGSATICRDFIAGTCRRGTQCFFTHQHTEFDDRNRPVRSNPPDSRENKDRKNESLRYSVDDRKDYPLRSERSGDICFDFLKGRCRKGSSCRLAHHEDPDRNHEHESHRRVATPCKFFAAGNCRNGNHCKFSHQVRENFSPERRSRDDRRGSDHKHDHGRSPDSDEPRWTDAMRASNVHDWEEDNETLAVNSVGPGDLWDRRMAEAKQIWGNDEPKIQGKTENSGAPIEVDDISGDMLISPRDVSNQQNSSLYSETPSLSGISFPTVQPDTTSGTPRDKDHHYDFPDLKQPGDAYAGENPNFEDKLNMHSGGKIDATPNPPMDVQPVQDIFLNDPYPNLSINPNFEDKPSIYTGGKNDVTPHPPMDVQTVQDMFPNDPHVNIRPPKLQLSPLSPSINAPTDQGISPGDPRVKFRPTLSVNPLHSHGGNGIQTSHDPIMFLDNNAIDGTGPHLGSANVTQPVPNLSTVGNEQLTELSHLSMNLAQLLESQQQLSLSSTTNLGGNSNFPDSTSSILPVSNATLQPSQPPETVTQGDPTCDMGQKMPKSGNQMLSSDNERCLDNANGENGGKIAENVTGDEDGKKLKDTKGLRSFKFALADYTKEILKPTWKHGKVNKENYKMIVKKVVDKVIETQGAQIPQTKEKIDQYLSCSKTKLEKLVQAYVGKYKTQPSE